MLTFANLDFRNTKKQQFAYLIKGLDVAWTYQQSNSIRINQLPYGEFELCLKAQNSDGKWGDKLTILIEVTKPVYLRSWFLVFAILLIISLILMLFKWRLSQLEKQQRILKVEVKKRTLQIEQDKETILQQTKELTKLDQLKSRFFTNISHELRTPLTLILGPAKQAQNHPVAIESPSISETFRLIENNGQQLLQLVEEILELSKLEANQIVLDEKPTHLSALIARLFANFESQAAYLGIDYQLLNWIGTQAIQLDNNKLQKIVNNLISNALKFTPKEGSIRLEVRENQTNTLQIEVIDTGKGIHPDDLPHVFERFYQSKQLNGIEQGGTGIGLTLAKELAEVMKGTLTVDSVLEKGSTFTLRVPLQVTTQTIKEISLPKLISTAYSSSTIGIEQQSGSSSPSLTKLLVVEDNPSMLAFICGFLQEEYQVVTARNGKEALGFLDTTSEKIELIVSDVMMPEVDGFTLLKTVKGSKKWRSIPMIMLTARAAETDKLQALRIGVDDYVTKPFSTDELKARIHNLIQNHRERQWWQEEEQSEIAIEKKEGGLNKKSTEELSEVNQEWLARLEKIMFNSIGHNQLSMDDIADEMHVSKRQLNRKLKQLTGLSPLKYQREMQLQQARQLLEKGTYATVAEVAHKAGFKTHHYFTRHYIERFGKKPSEYFK